MQKKSISIIRVHANKLSELNSTQENAITRNTTSDAVVIEEPLYVVLKWFSDQLETKTTNVMTTMRTPGHDVELVKGWLKTQSFIHSGQIASITQTNKRLNHEGPILQTNTAKQNLVVIKAKPDYRLNVSELSRLSSITSSCGICGDTALDNLTTNSCVRPVSKLTFSHSDLSNIIDTAMLAATLFTDTGGSHASAAFSIDNSRLTSILVAIREDVGRHNALDKLVGSLNREQLNESAILLSGRVSADLMQKIICSGVPVVLSIGAPSNLAIEIAETEGVILIGFIRGAKFNIYAGQKQINFIGTENYDS